MGAARQTGLADIRRLEAAGFRSWPAAETFYDGAWAIRLTPDLPARRLNSINPLDPADDAPADRLERARERLGAIGKPLVMRVSPLAGEALPRRLEAAGWSAHSPSLVMRADLAKVRGTSPSGAETLSASEFLRHAVAFGSLDVAHAAGMENLLARLGDRASAFALRQDGEVAGVGVRVVEGGLAGFFEIAVAPEHRGRGLGRRLMKEALDHAAAEGARTAWLQVEEDNAPARTLYASLGFETIYGYRYLTAPEAG